MISDASDLSPRFCIKCLSFQRKAKARSYFCMTAGVNTTSASVSKMICSECFNVIELSSFGCKIQKPSLNIINLTRGWKLEVYPSFRVGIFLWRCTCLRLSWNCMMQWEQVEWCQVNVKTSSISLKMFQTFFCSALFADLSRLAA